MLTLSFASSSNEDFETDISFRQRKPEFANVNRPTIDQTDPVDLSGAEWAGSAANERGVKQFDYVFNTNMADVGIIKVTATKSSPGPGLPIGDFMFDILRTTNDITRRVVVGKHKVEKGITVMPA